ncbi:PD-(D/E)XK nuclease family protein [Nocardioides sp.]|uniref:RecB family exonuclease n=1 Tax=Nocardioides sp. TaxID=35761 RepID=UPI002716051B|nr:PD-(D/E)XK nuclease family protein [Nocardioides sp.]MDO9456006.1 PD-(D/E)XK nuclease family protein [Nocardioides sp.]
MGTDIQDAPAEETPAERVSTKVDGVDVLGALSPSRASDFLSCPLLYRFRTVDRLPEPPSVDAVRGTVVHQVLEDLFDLPATERTPVQAEAMVQPVWEQVLADYPEAGLMFGAEGADVVEWLASCRSSVRRYFDLEDPTRLEPAERELYVEALLDSKLLLRGFVDRVDEAPDGALRLNDYKTGKSPAEGFEARALFQLRFYALVLWRTRGVVPQVLRLIYLGSSELITYEPDEQDLLATERKVEAVWRAIRYAEQTGDWQPRRSALCGWCAHQALCPAWGGTPPPLPLPTTERDQPDPSDPAVVPPAAPVAPAPAPSSG